MSSLQPNRQFDAAGCRRVVMAAVFFAGAFATQVAGAEVGLTLIVTSSTAAPVTAVVTASVAGDDPIVAYDWGLLPTTARCRQKSCELDVPIASCRRVEAEVTTVLGERATANAQVCAGDDGDPPRVTISVRDVDALEVWAVGTAGSDGVAIVRMWVDRREPVDDGAVMNIPRDGNCHAVDALVVDGVGRVGFDRRTICTSKDAPRAWIGYDDLCPPVGATQTLCNETEQRLGLGVTTASISAFEVNTCVTKPAPTQLVREVLVADDVTGRRVFTGAFLCGRPADGPRRLFFAKMPTSGSGVSGRSLRISPSLFGGTPPFVIQVSIEGERTEMVGAVTSRPQIEVRRLPFVGEEETREFAVRMAATDANGLTASAVGSVTVRGESVVVPGPIGAQDGSACTTAPAPMTPWLCVIAFGVLVRRRRR